MDGAKGDSGGGRRRLGAAWRSQSAARCAQIAHAFAPEVSEDDAKGFLLSKKQIVTQFLSSVDAPSKLLVLNQPRQEGAAGKELFLAAGDNEKIRGKCVYFLRDSDAPINVTIPSDEKGAHDAGGRSRAGRQQDR
jgi:hypothetical protein